MSERKEEKERDPDYIHIPLKGEEAANIGDPAKQKISSSAATEADEALNKTVETVNRVVKKGNKFTDGNKIIVL